MNLSMDAPRVKIPAPKVPTPKAMPKPGLLARLHLLKSLG